MLKEGTAPHSSVLSLACVDNLPFHCDTAFLEVYETTVWFSRPSFRVLGSWFAVLQSGAHWFYTVSSRSDRVTAPHVWAPGRLSWQGTQVHYCTVHLGGSGLHGRGTGRCIRPSLAMRRPWFCTAHQRPPAHTPVPRTALMQ